MKTGIIVLAAGSSSRLGRPKQMLDIDGEPLLLRTVRVAAGANAVSLAVVLGSNEEAHRALLGGEPVDIVYNDKWKSGMGSSIKSGLSHLLSRDPSLEAIIVVACDQPLLKTENIENLISKHKETGKPVIASRYSGMPGVPVLFETAYFDKLLALPDNEGAKKIILQNRGDVAEVDFPGGEMDLDTLEDYDAFTKRKPDPSKASRD